MNKISASLCKDEPAPYRPIDERSVRDRTSFQRGSKSGKSSRLTNSYLYM